MLVCLELVRRSFALWSHALSLRLSRVVACGGAGGRSSPLSRVEKHMNRLRSFSLKWGITWELLSRFPARFFTRTSAPNSLVSGASRAIFPSSYHPLTSDSLVECCKTFARLRRKGLAAAPFIWARQPSTPLTSMIIIDSGRPERSDLSRSWRILARKCFCWSKNPSSSTWNRLLWFLWLFRKNMVLSTFISFGSYLVIREI